MIDWGYPGRKDQYLTIDDHVNGYMDDVIDFIRKEKASDQVNLMGICMGGTFTPSIRHYTRKKLKTW